MTTNEQKGLTNLAKLCEDILNAKAREEWFFDDNKKRIVETEKKPDEVHSWTWTYTTEVNGRPIKAKVQEIQTKEDGLERNVTEITVGKTRKIYYEINRWETENRIAEVAEEEEDRINGEA